MPLKPVADAGQQLPSAPVDDCEEQLFYRSDNVVSQVKPRARDPQSTRSRSARGGQAFILLIPNGAEDQQASNIAASIEGQDGDAAVADPGVPPLLGLP
jgi:hypothetical protein